MEIALIAPYSRLDDIKGRPYQMMLPVGARRHEYSRTYGTIHRDSADTYLILDNGMFEEDMVTNEHLMYIANTWMVDEIVMPDVRGDMETTLYRIDQFLNVFEADKSKHTPNLMAAIQVKSIKEIPIFLDRLLAIQDAHFGDATVFTIGIPRRLVETVGQEARIDIVERIEVFALDNPIHLLGYVRAAQDPVDFNEVAILHDKVRSLDTGAPYVWAAHGASIANTRQTWKSEGSHLETVVKINTIGQVEQNIKILDNWAHGRS